MIVKNIYGASIAIPFGDWEPRSKWHQFPDGEVGVTDSGDYCQDFGKFSKEGFQEILAGLARFKQEYTWIESIEKWLPNHMVDK